MSKYKKGAICGIYRIRHIESGKSYIGQAIDITRRWTEHVVELRSNSHRNPHLQNYWNKHGEMGFAFEIIIRLHVEFLTQQEIISSLVAMEQKFLDREVERVGKRNIFNSNLQCVTSPLGTTLSELHKIKIKAGVNQPDVIQKIRDGAKRRWEDPEYKAKMSAVSRARQADPENRKQQAMLTWPTGAIAILWHHEASGTCFTHWGITETCGRLGISRPRVSGLLAGRLRGSRAGGWTVRFVYEGESLEGISDVIPSPEALTQIAGI